MEPVKNGISLNGTITFDCHNVELLLLMTGNLIVHS